MSKQNIKYGAYAAMVLAAAVIFLGVFNFRQGAAQQVPFANDELAIVSKNGDRHVFKVEVATTPQQLAQGLMYRDHMDGNHGMLFIFPSIEPVTMWMHNTQISLDILFMDAGNKIIHIAPNNRPYDDQQIPSGGLTRSALELNAGKAAELGLSEGDSVENRLLGTPKTP